MKEFDVKVISIIISFVFIFTFFYPATVNADNDIPEDVIEFKDEKFRNELIRSKLNTNNDEYITISEMEAYEGTINIDYCDAIGELRYAKNITGLYIYDTSIDDLDFTNFTKLVNFSYYPPNSQNVTENEIQKIKTGLDYLFFSLSDNYRSIYGKKLPEQIALLEKEAEYIDQINGDAISINEEVAKVNLQNNVILKSIKIVGVQEGTTKIVLSNDISTKEITVNVSKSNINPNQPLNNTQYKVKFFRDCILQSNGDLWKIKTENENISAEKIATNIKDYSYIYSRRLEYEYRSILDKNHSITIKKSNYEDNTNETEIKNIQNIKEMYHVHNNSILSYVNENNELYTIDLYNNDYEPQLLLSNVDEIKGAYIISEGKTYKIDSRYIVKVSDSVIDKQNRGFYSIGNNLYSFENELLATDFKEFKNESYYTTDGKLKSLGTSSTYPFGTETNVIKGDEKSYYINSENELLVSENLEILNNVTDYIEGIFYGARPYLFIARTDGTVWARKEKDTTSCVKVIDTVEGEIIKGDINNDGETTLFDAFVILKKAIFGASIAEKEIQVMDFNDDGNFTLYDAFCFFKLIILG